MTAAAWVFWIAAAVTFGYGPAFALTLILRDRRDQREDKRLRAEEDGQADAEWLALPAATETTPIYDQLTCEAMEKAEGWSA